ncbi:MAG: hypothetical protein GEEBNDBF_00833 [bacterium]|nr:hypothetical protein [bacterium]
MRALSLAGTLLALTTLAIPATVDARPADPLIRLESDMVYDGAYVMQGMEQLLAKLEAEFAEDPEALESFRTMMVVLHGLGLADIREFRQKTRLDDSGFEEEFTISFDPAGEGTPVGRWLTHAGTRSTFGRELAPADFMMATTLSRPGDYLTMCAESMETKAELMTSPEAPFGMREVHGALSIFHEYLPKLQAVLSGADAIHFVLWNAEPMALKADVSMLVEYDESAAGFAEHLLAYTGMRKLTWSNSTHNERTYQVLQKSDRFPIPLVMFTEGRLAVLATDIPTAEKTLQEALVSTKILLPEYVYQTRLNVEKIRQQVPAWAVDLALSAAGPEATPSGMPDPAAVLNLQMGEVTVLRSATPHAFTMTVKADRQLVHALYKAYELGMVSAASDMIRSEQASRKRQALMKAAGDIELALDDYYLDRGQYPTSIAELVRTGFLAEMPVNPFTRDAMAAVEFDARSPGNFTYVTQRQKGKNIGCQLLVYGHSDDYADAVDNYTLTEDGLFITEGDGYEDMVTYLVVRPDDLSADMGW